MFLLIFLHINYREVNSDRPTSEYLPGTEQIQARYHWANVSDVYITYLSNIM